MTDSVYQKTVLPNGIRVATEAMPNVRSITVGVWVDVGSRDEEANENGISHLLEHMIFKGTARRTALDIAKELDAIGGMSNAFTCKEQTCFHAKVLDTHLDQVVDLLLDIFRNSLFEPLDIEREKQVVLQEISMVEETPDEYSSVLFSQEFWGDNSLGRSVLGSVEAVSSFSHEKIASYIGNSYIPSRTIITAAGNVDHQRFLNLLRGPLESMVPINGRNLRVTPHIGRVVKTIPRNAEQVHLNLGGRGPAAADETRYADTLLSTILGGTMSSRLFQEIREKRGLAYTVYSYISSHVDIGRLGFYLAVRPDTVVPALEVLFNELELVRSGRLDQAELDAAREYLKGSVLLTSESSESRMMRLARNEIAFERLIPFDEMLEKVNAVTVDDVIELARTRLDPASLSIVSYGPYEKDLDLFS